LAGFVHCWLLQRVLCGQLLLLYGCAVPQNILHRRLDPVESLKDAKTVIYPPQVVSYLRQGLLIFNILLTLLLAIDIRIVPAKVKQAANILAAFPKHIAVALSSANLLPCQTDKDGLSFEISNNTIAKILNKMAAAIEFSKQLYYYSTSKILRNNKRKGNGKW
jgi:hypothetical protein